MPLTEASRSLAVFMAPLTWLVSCDWTPATGVPDRPGTLLSSAPAAPSALPALPVEVPRGECTVPRLLLRLRTAAALSYVTVAPALPLPAPAAAELPASDPFTFTAAVVIPPTSSAPLITPAAQPMPGFTITDIHSVCCAALWAPNGQRT